mmetsp:Transcript_45607/g.89836  ORF Transcript_45607/g.89836 Transcript_45607/m.89836 type:complete len:316 (+) Transcript_45607:90-1037(+)
MRRQLFSFLVPLWLYVCVLLPCDAFLLPSLRAPGARDRSPHATVLMNEKTTKEIKRGRRFTGWKGPSTRWRHFGVPGKGNPRRNKVTGEPWKPITLPKRRCMLLQQIDNKRARTVTFSDKRNKRVQKVNLHWKRFWWPEGERMVLLRVSCRAMRTIRKLGIDAAAKKYKLPLHKKKYSAGKSPRFRGHPENKYNRRIAGMTKAQFIKAQSMGQVKKEFVTQAAIDFLEFSRTNPTGAYDRKMADLVPDGLETEGMDMAELEALKMVRDRPAGEEEETFEFEAKEEEEEEDVGAAEKRGGPSSDVKACAAQMTWKK